MDVDGIIEEILKNGSLSVIKDLKRMNTHAEKAFRSLVVEVITITRDYGSKKITQKQARNYLKNIKVEVVAVLAVEMMMAEGAAQNLVNGALSTIKKTVNGAVGFELIE